jgi:hypothetical protein
MKEYLVTETYDNEGKCVVFYQEFKGQNFNEFKSGSTGDVYQSVIRGKAALNAYLNEFEAI